MSAKAGEPQDIREISGGLPVEELRAVLLSAADRHPDVERHVRLAAARASGDLVQLRGEVDRGLRTRRFLGYRESSEWARAARPIVDELRIAVWRARHRSMSYCSSAVGHVVKVILRADDSNGTIGDLAREVTGTSQQNVSKHLLVMYRAGLVTRRPQGSNVYYSLTDQSAHTVLDEMLASVKRQLRELSDPGFPGVSQCRRRDSNPRHADYD